MSSLRLAGGTAGAEPVSDAMAGANTDAGGTSGGEPSTNGTAGANTDAGVPDGGDPCQGVICTASSECLTSACDPTSGKCLELPKLDGTACDDGNRCIVGEACQSGVCAGGQPMLCPPVDSCQEAGSCDPGAGQCVSPVKQDGALCDDGDPCTLDDACEFTEGDYAWLEAWVKREQLNLLFVQ